MLRDFSSSATSIPACSTTPHHPDAISLKLRPPKISWLGRRLFLPAHVALVAIVVSADREYLGFVWLGFRAAVEADPGWVWFGHPFVTSIKKTFAAWIGVF